MKKLKFLRYYYARLTMVSLVSVLFLVSAVTLGLLAYLQSSRTVYAVQEHEAALRELEAEYNDIWNNYYRAFMPLTDSFYEKDLYAFCRGEGYGYDRYTVRRAFKRILADICQQDRRIKGVYFRRCFDDSGFLYSDDSQLLRQVSFELGTKAAKDRSRRALVGGMVLHMSDGGTEEMAVFGIQSGIQSVARAGDTCEYQISVLYDLNGFDQILAGHDTDSEARFRITAADGMVIYDSWGEYLGGEAVYYEDINVIVGKGDAFRVGSATYQKGVRDSARGGGIVFYTIPSGIRFNGTMGLVCLLAASIVAVVSVAMLSVNRLANRKFRELEWGMQQIGKNNLGFRLPLGRQEDEFFRIASRFNRMCDELEDTINKNYIYQLLQKNAAYEALQASVNPHFLYNSLEAIRELLDCEGQEDGAEMVLLLSRIFEYQIRGESIVTIQKEVDALRSYIDFSSIRFRYAFEYSMDFDEEILDCAIPKQIFQPIAENYFAHGLRGDGEDRIDIRGYMDAADGMIHVRFCDNGKGLTGEQADALTQSLDDEGDNSHIGLRNVHQRLKLALGEESHVSIISNAPGPGACILLVFGRTWKLKGLR